MVVGCGGMMPTVGGNLEESVCSVGGGVLERQLEADRGHASLLPAAGSQNASAHVSLFL